MVIPCCTGRGAVPPCTGSRSLVQDSCGPGGILKELPEQFVSDGVGSGGLVPFPLRVAKCTSSSVKGLGVAFAQLGEGPLVGVVCGYVPLALRQRFPGNGWAAVLPRSVIGQNMLPSHPPGLCCLLLPPSVVLCACWSGNQVCVIPWPYCTGGR